MEIYRVPTCNKLEGNLSNEQEAFLEQINNCQFCGSKLFFNHLTDLINLKVKEETHCPSCGIHQKSQEFAIQ